MDATPAELASDARRIKDIIVSAFDGVPPPYAATVCNDYEHFSEVERLISHFPIDHWRDVPVDAMEDNRSGLGVMRPEAFRFFLPAYLCRALDAFESSEVVPPLVMILWPSGGRGRADFLQLISALDDAQRCAVGAFLEFFAGVDVFGRSLAWQASHSFTNFWAKERKGSGTHSP